MCHHHCRGPRNSQQLTISRRRKEDDCAYRKPVLVCKFYKQITESGNQMIITITSSGGGRPCQTETDLLPCIGNKWAAAEETIGLVWPLVLWRICYVIIGMCAVVVVGGSWWPRSTRAHLAWAGRVWLSLPLQVVNYYRHIFNGNEYKLRFFWWGQYVLAIYTFIVVDSLRRPFLLNSPPSSST